MGTWSVRLNLSSHKLPFLLLGSQLRGLGEGAGEGPRPEARVLTSLGHEHHKTEAKGRPESQPMRPLLKFISLDIRRAGVGRESQKSCCYTGHDSSRAESVCGYPKRH